jgi:hypothetical protein
MPSATAKTAPTAKVQTTTITKTISDPVEGVVVPPPPEPPPEPQQDFWKYIESLSPTDWKHHHVSLYRYPLNQTKPHKLGRYVRTYKNDCPLLNEEQIFEEFGGGQYDALMRGPATDGSGRVTLIAKYSWEMDGPAKNPWSNSNGAAAVGPGPSELANTLQIVLQNLKQAQGSSNPTENPAIKTSIELISQLTNAMPKPQGVGELVSALADLKKLTGGADTGNSLADAIKLLKELGVVGGERKSLIEELKGILEIAGMMGQGGGGTGGGKRDWGTALIDSLPTVLEKATPIAEKYVEATRNNARVAELRAGVIRPMPVAATAAAAAAPAPVVESPAPRVVRAPETEPATAPAVAETMQTPNLIWVKARAVELFQSGKSGDAIAEFLDSLDDKLGNFLGAMNAEQFAEFVKSDAILKQIAAAPRFTEFVSEFVSYFSTEEAPESA